MPKMTFIDLTRQEIENLKTRLEDYIRTLDAGLDSTKDRVQTITFSHESNYKKGVDGFDSFMKNFPAGIRTALEGKSIKEIYKKRKNAKKKG